MTAFLLLNFTYIMYVLCMSTRTRVHGPIHSRAHSSKHMASSACKNTCHVHAR